LTRRTSVRSAVGVLVGTLLLAGVSADAGALQRGRDLQGPGLGVPFVAQGPLLCGGAVAAMVERHWGALGAYAEDYSSRVVPEAGGIHTGDLARAMEERGYRTRVFRGAAEEALDRVREGTPVVALLSSGRDAYHYVLVTAVGSDRVMVHDPQHRPGMIWEREDFQARWAASEYWALAAVPTLEAELGPGTAGSGGSGPGPADGSSASGASSTLPSSLLAATEALRGNRPADAERQVGEWLETATPEDPSRPLAWRLLASARYLDGRSGAALEAWNRVGEPRVDLVQLRGLQGMRHRLATRFLGLAPRDTLRRSTLVRAQRRLMQLPSVRLGRMAYQPLRDGSVRVEAGVLERAVRPGLVEGLGLGLNALVTRTAEVGSGPVLGLGERLHLGGSWEEARPGFQGSVALPWPDVGGVVRMEAGGLRERYASGEDGGAVAHTRRWSAVGLRSWIRSWLRGGVRASAERWDGGELRGSLGASVRLVTWEDRLVLDGNWTEWSGTGGGRRVGLKAAAAHDLPGPGRTRLVAGWSHAPRGPALLWPGAGVGRHRTAHLRGHPLADEGRLGAEALGRTLLHGTVEYALPWQVGPLPVEVAAFVDGVRVREPLVGSRTRDYLDPGLELRLRLPGAGEASPGPGGAAVSVARGDGGWVWSARLTGGVPLGLSAP